MKPGWNIHLYKFYIRQINIPLCFSFCLNSSGLPLCDDVISERTCMSSVGAMWNEINLTVSEKWKRRCHVRGEKWEKWYKWNFSIQWFKQNSSGYVAPTFHQMVSVFIFSFSFFKKILRISQFTKICALSTFLVVFSTDRLHLLWDISAACTIRLGRKKEQRGRGMVHGVQFACNIFSNQLLWTNFRACFSLIGMALWLHLTDQFWKVSGETLH